MSPLRGEDKERSRMRMQHITAAEKHPRPYGDLVLLAGNTPGAMRTAKADLKLLVIEPGQKTSHHRHLVAESIFHVLEGQLEYLVDGAKGTLGPGDTVIIEPGTFHCLQNVGSHPTRVLEIESPPHDRNDKQLHDAQRAPIACPRPAGRFWLRDCGLRIKVCGVANPDAAHLCDVYGVDAIGIHAVGKGRMEKVRFSERWLSSMHKDLSIFLLTDAEDPLELSDLARLSWCDTIQLQGNKSLESVARCAEAMRAGGWKIVKSVGMDDLGAGAFAYARAVAVHCDAVLLDTSFRGGTGQIADWALARRIVDELTDTAVLLAGGLTPENVSAAVAAVQPFGVDVETGVEVHFATPSGEARVSARSPDKLRGFIAAARTAETE